MGDGSTGSTAICLPCRWSITWRDLSDAEACGEIVGQACSLRPIFNRPAGASNTCPMASAPARGLTNSPQLHNCPTYYDEVDAAAAHCHRCLAGPRHRTPRPSIAVPRRAWHPHSHRCGTGSARTPQRHADRTSQAGADARGTAEQHSEEAAWTVTASLLPVDKVLNAIALDADTRQCAVEKRPHECSR